MRFEPNLGQTDAQARFLSRGDGYSLFLTSNGAVLSLLPPAETSAASTTAPTAAPATLTMNLVGASSSAAMSGANEMTSVSNYLRGADASQWITNVPNYGEVDYQRIYPGVDLAYHGTGQQLEYDFTVAPGTDPSAIRWNIQGDNGLSLDAQGNLVLHTTAGDLVEHAPVIYQGGGADRQAVTGGYMLDGNGQVSFTIGAYDHARPLVIDPVLAYATYLGNNRAEFLGFTEADAVAVDKQGNAYLTGTVSTVDFPTVGGVQPSFNGYGFDAFVTKLDKNGQIIFSTYLGGQGDETHLYEDPEIQALGYTELFGQQFVLNDGYGIAIRDDGSGNVDIYVTGTTNVGDTGLSKIIGYPPTVGSGIQDGFGGGALTDNSTTKELRGYDAFVAELKPNGAGFVYSSYLGGHADDIGFGIAVDSAGNAYVVGTSVGHNSQGGLSGKAAFVTRINANGSFAWRQTFGSETDQSETVGRALAIDQSSNIYFAGFTNNTDFATSAPVAESVDNADAFVAKLAPDGSLLAATRLGGQADDSAEGVAADEAGNIYLAGTTYSSNFPVTQGAFDTSLPRAVGSAFVAKLTGDLTHLVYSTYLGGTQGVTATLNTGSVSDLRVGDYGHAIAVDQQGDAIVVGSTASTDFPVANAIQAQHSAEPKQFADNTIAGPSDAFVTMLTPSGNALRFSTYLGGSGNDVAKGVAIDPVGGIYVVGQTDSTDFNVTYGPPPPAQTSYTRPAGGSQNITQLTDNNFFYTPNQLATSAFVARIAPPLHVIPLPIKAAVGKEFVGTVASFTAGDPGASTGDFTATIDWGDGNSTDTGVILQPNGPQTPFAVGAGHTYTHPGAYPVVVTIHDTKQDVYATAATTIDEEGSSQQDPTIINPAKSRFLNIVGTDASGVIDQVDDHRGDGYWAADTSNLQDALKAAGAPTKGIRYQITNISGADFLLYESLNDNDFGGSINVDTRVNTYHLPSVTGPLTPLLNLQVNNTSGDAVLASGPGQGGQGGSAWIAINLGSAIYVQEWDVSGGGKIGATRVYHIVPPQSGSIVLYDIAVGPTGQAAVAYALRNINGTTASELLVAPIANNLASGQVIRASGTVDNTSIQFPTSADGSAFQFNDGMKLAWDRSSGANRGTLYVVYSTTATGGENTYLLVKASRDGGKTWGAASVPDQGSDFSDDEFLPSIAVNQSTGDVAVFWYATLKASILQKVYVYASALSPGKSTFSNPVQVSEFDTGASLSGTSLVFSGGFLYPAWVDDSGKLGSGFTGKSLAASAVAVAHVTVPPPSVKVGHKPKSSHASVTGQRAATELATVAAPASSVASGFNLTQGQTFSGTVASISDADGTLQASSFTALIDWGDGSSATAGTITAVPSAAGGGFAVTASHLYAQPGAFVMNVRVHDSVNDLDSSSAVDVTQTPGSEINGAIAIDPTNANNQFVVSDADGGLVVATSNDGGATWTSRSLADGNDRLPLAAGDAKAAFDAYGNLFLTYVTSDNPSAVVIALSTDDGQSFSLLDTFSDGFVRPALATGTGSSGTNGSVWLSFTRASDNSLWAAHADVTGLGSVGAFSQLYQGFTAGDPLVPAASDVSVGPNGQALIVFEAYSAANNLTNLIVLPAQTVGPTSTTSAPIAAQSRVNAGDLIPAEGVHGIDAQAQLAWDLSPGPHRGRLYLVYTDASTAGDANTDIFVRYSDDQGATWSAAVRVNDDTGTASQFQPSIAVDPATGDVAVSWRDTRNDPNNITTEIFTAVSDNGGQAFSSNVAVSTGASDGTNADLDALGQQNQFGDYTGLAFLNGTIYPLWADNSTSLAGNLDQPQFDIAVAANQVVEVAAAPLTAQPLDISNPAKTEGESFTADLANVTGIAASATAGLYTATIDWGDQTAASSGTIRQDISGVAIVSGTHAYREEGSYTITVTVQGVEGGSATVTLNANVADAPLTAVNQAFRPAAGTTLAATGATFTDANSDATPADYQTTLDWGDGTTASGQIVYDGTAAFTWAPDGGLYAIGKLSSGLNAGATFLMSVGYGGDGKHAAVTSGPYPLMQLTPQFRGGLAPDYNNLNDFYAISTNDAGESFLNLLTPALPATSSTIQRVGYLGLGFTGGLTYDGYSGVYYAIAQQGAVATLYSIDPKTYAVHAVGSLGALSFSGLAVESSSSFLQPPQDILYAVANDTRGDSTLYRIVLGSTLAVTDMGSVGSGLTGGLAITGSGFNPPPETMFAIAGDGSGAAYVEVIAQFYLQGHASAKQLGEIGPQFNNGFDVVGSHTYSAKSRQTIRVTIDDVGGSTTSAQATAQVGDVPPVGLAPPPAFTAFQSFETGGLTLAEFMVPGGVGLTTNQYSATVDWGDGSQSEPAVVTLAAGQLVVTSPGHTFQTAGTTSPTITLTDDSGNTATVTDTVDVLPDVAAEAKVVGLGGPVNASSGLITSSGTVTDVGGVTLKGPLYLIVKNLPSGVTLTDADGTLVSGQPYRLLQVSQLSPGQSASETLQFSDPGLTPFTYSVTVIDGPLGAPTPAGATPAMGGAGSGFVANVGQSDARVQFISQGAGYSLFLTSSGAVLDLEPPMPTRSVSEGNTSSMLSGASALADASGSYATSPTVVELSLLGANTSAAPVGLDPLSGTTNYLLGNDPSKWQTGATSYARVEYRDVYPGVTLDYHTSANQRLEYDFTVAAGADPNVIRLAIQGAESAGIDDAGNLVLHMADGDVVEQAPVLYQQVGGTRQTVAGGYVVEPDGSVGFRVGPYDASLPLVIDPVLAFSTYLGGSTSDQGNGIAVDADGNVYVTGQTASLDFPTLGGFGSPPDRLGQPSGGTVAFVTKYDPTGALVYSTYFGGSGEINFVGGVFGDFSNAIAVDAAHEAVVVGKTYSADFPLVNALPSQPSNGASAFVAKLNAAGTGFVFSTYLQGSFAGTGVAIDPAGNIYVAGSAQIGVLPAYSFQTTPGAASSSVSSSFLEKLSPAGGSVLYATYVPGTEITNVPEVSGAPTQIPAGTVNALAVDSAGNAYLTGTAFDERYENPAAPPPSGPVLHAAQSTFGGGEFDAFVAKLNTTGTALDYWTYLGGNDNDVGNAIAVDSTGAAYVAGTTMSTNLPTTNAVQGALGGIGLAANNVSNLRGQGLVAGDAFVAKLNPDGSSFAYVTYLGGSGPDMGTGIAIDSAHNAYVTGQAGSADFPTAHALQPTFGGDEAAQTLVPYIYGRLGEGDAFLARINANGGTLDYSTFLGGSGTDRGNAVAVTPSGQAFVTGFTKSSDFPTFNAAQPQSNLLQGNLLQDLLSERSTAFVARIDAQGAGVIHVTSVAFAATESVAFSGVVASFTDSDTDTAANYSATIDWGDGATSVGSVTPNKSSGFNVNGTHTYAEDGKFPVVVTIHDADGSVASASDSSLSLRERVGVRAANYQISVDTSSLAGTAGFLDFQFNPGALPGAQAADVIISQFQDGGGSLGSATLAGAASGSLAGTGQLTNSSVLNELKQALTFGSTLSFEVTLEGDALNIPLDGLFGSMLSLTMLAADGVTPLQATAADGTAVEIAVSPTGDVALVGPANNPLVQVAAVTTINVADAPLQATLVPIQAVEAITFGGAVATFTDGNANASASDFTTSILWGDGTAASTGTVVADGGGRFHVTGSHTFAEAGNYAIQVVVLDKGGSQTIAAASSTAPSAQITGLQAPRSAYEGGSLSMASGDLRHDGKLDLVVARYVPGTLQTELLILLGNGDGSFQSPLHLAIPTTDTLNAFSPVIADFNGDGKPDIAAAGMVFLGNGDGTFRAGVPFDAGTLPIVAQAAGDLNGDGKLDLVVAGGAGIGGSAVGVRVLMGNGDGTFQNAVTYGTETGQTVSQLFLGNFHGNGKPDIVFSTTAGNTWLLPNLGNGTFGTATLIASGLSVAAVGDLKGNGKLDLVAFDGTPSSPGTHVAVLMGNGDGTFQTPVSYAVGLSLMLATVGDFSGDGKPDIAVADEGTSVEGGTFGAAIHLLRNNGDGTFAAPVSYATQPVEVGNLVTGDFNGDGNLDLAMENNSSGLNGSPASISMLLGRGDGTFVDGPFTPTGNSVSSIATADFNGDGRSDVALTGGVPGVEVLNGNGDGTYQSAHMFATPDATQTGSNLLSADFNGDGHTDLLTGTLLFAGNGNGTYQPATSWNAAGVKAIATGDFMGDGHSDLVSYTYNNANDTTAVSLWLNDGHGSFHTSWSYTVPGIAAPPVVADFNGDGKPDLAIAVDDKGEVLVFINNGDGTFKTPLTDTIASSYLEATTAGDFRGDGKEDLAVVAQGGVFVLLGNGDGTFQTAVNVYPTAAGIYSISTGDFNRDGKADLLLTTQPNTTEVVTVLISNGDGTFRTGQSIDTALNSVSGAIVADLNGDGKLDFAVAGEAVHVYLGNGDGTFQAGPVYATGNLAGEAFLTLAAADVTGNGRVDLLTMATGFGASGATFGILLAQPDGTLRAGRVYGSPGELGTPLGPQAFDLNHDGKPDLVAIETTPSLSQDALVLLNNGDGTFQAKDYDFRTTAQQQQGLRIQVAAFTVGDFNGDGIPDIVADVTDSNFNSSRVLLVGNGDGTFQAPRDLPLANSYSTTVLQAVDINGDGKLDLVTFGEIPFNRQVFVQVELGDGKGGFQPPIVTGPLANVDLLSSATTAANAFALGDFNGDGKLDVAVGTTDGSVEMLPGNGDGTFQAPVNSPLGMPATQFVSGDLDGNGKADLVAVDAAGVVALLRGNSDSTFQQPLRYSTSLTVGQLTSNNSFVSLADVNGDGVPDVVIGTAFGIATIINQRSLATENVADATLTATGQNDRAVQGATFFGTVARFTDANPQGTASDFAATITWGDGAHSAGTVEADPNGGFDVLGTHVYTSAGTLNVSVAIADEDGSTAAASSAIAVSTAPDATLSATGDTIGATAGVAFSGVVATFLDGDPAGTVSDFTAMIDWGDGHKSLGVVNAGTGGVFQVVGANTYAQAATYEVAVSIFDVGGATATAASTADITANNHSPLTAVGVTIQAVEQAAFAGTVATFTDSAPGHQATDYTALIDWGDGETSAGAITADAQVSGQFDVVATHGYAEEGVYAVTLQISRSGASATANSTVDVADASLVVSGSPVSAVEATTFTGMVASFSDANPFGSLADYSATIDWGDNHTSTGQISADPAGFDRFDVTGSNTYAEAGHYVVSVTVTDRGGSTETVRLPASVADAPITSTGTPLSATIGAAFNGVVATFSDQNSASATADFIATVIWGDGQTTSGSVAPAAGGGFKVSGTHTYSSVGTLPVTVTILDEGGAIGRATATAVIVGPTVQASATAIQATEGLAFAGTVATFSIAASGLGDFAAAINWGNGQTTAGTILFDASTNRFDVLGMMTYDEEGSFTIGVSIGDRDGAAASLTSTAVVADASLGATATAVAASKGVPFAGAVAHFTDANPSAQPGDFTAQIIWGDGQTTTGAIGVDPSVAGQFDVTGSVTYQTTGSLPLAITVTDKGGATAAAAATAAVEVLPTASGTTLQEQATVPSSVAVAVINDANPGDQPSDFLATIAWGDGQTSTGLMTYDPTDKTHFQVLGNSPYANPGTYTLSVSLARIDGLKLNVTDSVTVSAAPGGPLTALPAVAVGATQGAAIKAVVGMFSDADPTAAPSDYTATINWGDGSTSGGSIVPLGTQGTFGVLGQHTYAGAGSDFVTVDINDAKGASLQAGNEVQISPSVAAETISAVGLSISGHELSPLTNAELATFTIFNGSPDPGALSATIHWGDGTTSAGAISLSGTTYTVTGAHTYGDEGRYAVAVNVAANNASPAVSAVATSQATIHEQLLAEGSTGTANQNFIQEIYRDLFGRLAEPRGRDFWTAELTAGTSRIQVAYEMVQLAFPEEFQHDTVAVLYEQYLGRAPDPGGQQFWTAYLFHGGTIESMSQALVSSPEYRQVRGGGTNAGYLQSLFHDALGRSIDPTALSYFEGLMADGVSAADVASRVFSSDEYHRLRVDALFHQFLDRPADPAALAYFAGELDGSDTDELVISQLLSSDEYFAKANE